MNKIIKIAAYAIGICTVLAGCQKEPDLKECWSADSKASLMALVRSSMSGKIEDIVLANSKGNPNNVKEFIDKALIVTIDTYHAVSRNSDAGSLSCGANVAMEYTKADGSVMKADNAPIVFSIYKAESGSVFSLDNTVALAALITRAK